MIQNQKQPGIEIDYVDLRSSLLEINRNIDIIMKLQLKDEVNEQIKRLQIEFLNQIFDVHYFDLINQIILTLVPDIINQHMSKLENDNVKTDSGIINGKSLNLNIY